MGRLGYCFVAWTKSFAFFLVEVKDQRQCFLTIYSLKGSVNGLLNLLVLVGSTVIAMIALRSCARNILSLYVCNKTFLYEGIS
jgi:hypothetical protein